MVKFDFVLEDHEAENLVSVLHEAIMRSKDAAILHRKKYPEAEPKDNWFDKHAAYLENIKNKMLIGNKRGQ